MTLAFSPLSTDHGLTLYREMLRIRLVEEAIARRYPEQKMRCPCHLSVGQEAAAVAVATHLEREDAVFSAHRGHAHYLAKGGDLKAMIAEIYGTSASPRENHGEETLSHSLCQGW